MPNAVLQENINKREANYLCIEQIIKNNDDFIFLKRDHINKLSTFAFPLVCKTKELRDIYVQKFTDAGVRDSSNDCWKYAKTTLLYKNMFLKYLIFRTDHMHDCGLYCGNYPELTEEDLGIIESVLKK